MWHFKLTHQTGYTLLELLLYIGIIGILLTAVTMFFGVTVDSRVKNQSISEVNDQGVAIMDSMLQTIHNASSITSPATGATGGSLTLTVPTGSLSPTVFDTSGTIVGYNGASTNTDSGDRNAMQATKFTASASGTISTLYGFIGGTVAASPNNKGEMAIYADGGGYPATFLGSAPSTTLLPNSWIAFPLSSSVTVTSGQIYWLVYNTNGIALTDNDINYHAGATNQSISDASQPYDSWPLTTTLSTWNGGYETIECLMYAPISVSGSPSAARIKEGAGSAVALSANDVEVTGLSFQNLTRAGTPGLVRISFTVSRVNPSNRNELQYSRRFTATAEVGW